MTMADSQASALAPNRARAQQIGLALKQVQARVGECSGRAQRSPEQVSVLAVSKTKPASDIMAAYQAGQRRFGENYVQEGIEKIQLLAELEDIEWHFIGPLQSNKSKDVANHFDWMQSLDRVKIAKRLNDQRPADKQPLQVLIQVNIDDEKSKSGITLDALADFSKALEPLEHLQLRGLMAIPKANASEAQQHTSFSALRQAFDDLKARYPQVDTLSLGMSNDLDEAISHGSTMVRIGTAIFGQRQA